MSLFVDLSMWQGETTRAEIAAASAAGVAGAIINTYGAFTQQQLGAWWGAGTRLDAYVYLNFPGGEFYRANSTGGDQVAYGLARSVPFVTDIEYVWLDVEDPGCTLPAADAVRFIHEAAVVVVAAGKKPGVYCSKESWVRITGDSHEFSDLPLWYCRPNGDKSLLLASDEQCGGWTTAFGIQYDWHSALLTPGGLAEVDADEMTEDPLAKPIKTFEVNGTSPAIQAFMRTVAAEGAVIGQADGGNDFIAIVPAGETVTLDIAPGTEAIVFVQPVAA